MEGVRRATPRLMRQLLLPEVALAAAAPGSTAETRPTIALRRETEQRLRRVLRLRDGARLTICDGRGGRAAAELRADGLVLLEAAAVVAPKRPELWLAFAPLKGDRGDWLVEKAVEIGVDVLVPLRCDHAVAKLDPGRADRQVQRWQALADAAVEQSGRPWRPRVAAPARVADLLASTQAVGTSCTWTVADERGGFALELAADAAIADHDRGGEGGVGAVGVVIGPEGGLSTAERALLAAAGVVAITLGDDVLRAETGALVALARLAAWRQRRNARAAAGS